MFKNSRKLKELEQKIIDLSSSVTALNCAAGRHVWEVRNVLELDPARPPYMRCAFCWKIPEKDKK